MALLGFRLGLELVPGFGFLGCDWVVLGIACCHVLIENGMKPLIVQQTLTLLHVCVVGAEDDSQADPDGEADREGSLRRGVDGQVEGREGGRQSFLHHR